MKGYKGMTAYMYCQGMKYEIGKTYHEDDIALCKKGLHFCKNLCDVFQFYGRGGGKPNENYERVEWDGIAHIIAL